MKNDKNKSSLMPQKLKRILVRSCVYFTALTLMLLIIQAFSADIRYVTPTRFLLIYPFSLSMALGDLVLKAKSMKSATKVITHYLISVGAFYAFLLAPAKNSGNPVVLILILTAVYFIVAIPVIVVRARKRKKETEAAPYVSVYSKKK